MEYIQKKLVRHIESRPNFEWNWSDLSCHPDMNTHVIKHFNDKPWNFTLLSTHPNFSFEWIDAKPDASWDWASLSRNIKLNISIVKKYFHKPWNWTAVTLNDGIKDDDMISNRDFPWVFSELGYTIIGFNELKVLRFFRNRFDPASWRDFTSHADWSIIKTNLDIPWDAACIQFKPGDISTNSDIEVLYYFMERGSWLNWNLLSSTADIHMIYKTSSAFPWNWIFVSQNPSVTHDDTTVSNLIPWDYNFTPLESDEQILRRWNSAKIIQRRWKKCITDPTHPVCRRRLEYEFGILEDTV